MSLFRDWMAALFAVALAIASISGSIAKDDPVEPAEVHDSTNEPGGVSGFPEPNG